MHLLLLLLLVSGAPHTGSVSASWLEVEGRTVGLRVQCQVLSLLEVIEGLDGDGDGFVSRAELARKERAITDYVGAHYRLHTPGAGEGPGGTTTRLAPRPVSVSPARAGARERIPLYDRVDVRFAFEAQARIDALLVRVNLFRVTSPDHQDAARVSWNGRAPRANLFVPGDEEWALQAPAGVAVDFLGAGLRAVPSGWAALAALCALLLPVCAAGGASSGRTLACFLGAEILALSLGGLDLVPTGAFALTLAAPLSVAYLGADSLVRRPEHARPLEVILFGLLHGWVLAGSLGTRLVAERAQFAGLLAFLLGLVLPQLAVSALVAQALRSRRGTRGGVRRALAIGLLVLGLATFARYALGG